MRRARRGAPAGRVDEARTLYRLRAAALAPSRRRAPRAARSRHRRRATGTRPSASSSGCSTAAPPADRAAESEWLAVGYYELGPRWSSRGGDAARRAGHFKGALARRPRLPAGRARARRRLRGGRRAPRGGPRRGSGRPRPAGPAAAGAAGARVPRRRRGPSRMIALYRHARRARAPDDLALAVALGRVYFELEMLDEAADAVREARGAGARICRSSTRSWARCSSAAARRARRSRSTAARSALGHALRLAAPLRGVRRRRRRPGRIAVRSASAGTRCARRPASLTPRDATRGRSPPSTSSSPRCARVCDAPLAERPPRSAVRRVLGARSPRLGAALVRRCGLPLPTLDPRAARDAVRASGPCGPCRARAARPWDWARAGAEYEGVVREAIHAFKFGGRRALAASAGRADRRAVGGRARAPASPRWCRCRCARARERERGFNQAGAAGRAPGGAACGVPVRPRLARARAGDTRPRASSAPPSGAPTSRGLRGRRRPWPAATWSSWTTCSRPAPPRRSAPARCGRRAPLPGRGRSQLPACAESSRIL